MATRSLEIAFNFIYRQPLFPLEWKSPNIDEYKNIKGPILDIHEFAAAKDIFDNWEKGVVANIKNLNVIANN